MDEASGGEVSGGGGGAVATVDTSNAVDIGPGGSGGESSVSTTDADATPASQGGFRAYEGGKLTKPMADGITAMRAISPKAAKAAATAVAVQNKLYSPFALADGSSASLGAQPFKTITSLLNFHKQAGGRHGIEAYRAQSDDIDEQNRLYADGDPKLLQRMTHTQKADGSWVPNPPAVVAFAKLVPHALEMIGKFSPNLALSLVAKKIVSHMDTLTYSTGRKSEEGAAITEPLELPYRMMRLEEALAGIQVADGNATIPVAKLKAIMADVGALTGFVNYLRGTLPNLQAEDLTPKSDPEAERRQLDADRRQVVIDTVVQKRSELMNEAYRKAWRNLNVATRATPAQQETIESLFKAQLDIARRSLADYRATVDRFVDSRDVAGYTTYHKDFFDRKVPSLLSSIVGKVLARPGAASNTASAATATTAAKPAAQAAQQSTAWKKVDSRPETNDLKMGPRFTTDATYSERRGFAAPGNHWKLPARTPVTW